MIDLATTTEVKRTIWQLLLHPPKAISPFKLINECQRSSKNQTTDEELLMEFGTFCVKLAESPNQCCKEELPSLPCR
jgi:hypothetical protein